MKINLEPFIVTQLHPQVWFIWYNAPDSRMIVKWLRVHWHEIKQNPSFCFPLFSVVLKTCKSMPRYDSDYLLCTLMWNYSTEVSPHSILNKRLILQYQLHCLILLWHALYVFTSVLIPASNSFRLWGSLLPRTPSSPFILIKLRYTMTEYPTPEAVQSTCWKCILSKCSVCHR